MSEELDNKNKEPMAENNLQEDNQENNQESNSGINYYDSKLKKHQYYESLEKEVNDYMEGKEIPKTSNLENIHQPLIKLLIAFILGLMIVKFLTPNMSNYSEIVGLWGDEYGNYYEIYDNTFEMNYGDSDNPFYVGTITNIIDTEDGYKILIKGKKYNIESDGTRSLDKSENIIFTIKNYTKELQKVMTANLGTDDYQITRLENTTKKSRFSKNTTTSTSIVGTTEN